MSLFLTDQSSAPASAPVFTMRPYQEKAVSSILDAQERGRNRVLLVLPTGCGKTLTFAEVIRRMRLEDPSLRSLILAHREELLRQAQEKVEAVTGLSVGLEAGPLAADPWDDVVAAGVQTIGRDNCSRLRAFAAKLLIIDESHHAPAASYQCVMERYGSYDGRCFTLGVTATPHRLDNKALHGRSDAIFEEVAFTYTLRQAIQDGYLCQIRGYRVASSIDLSKVRTTAGDFNQKQLSQLVDTEERNLAALRHWQEVAADRPTIVFCVDVNHARHVAELFRAHGVAAEHVDGGMRSEDRKAVMGRFTSGTTQVLTNVEIATEGFDYPPLSCVLMLRPTQSWSLYCQMAGRGTRLAPGKEDVLVIDVVDNSGRHALASVPALLGLPPGLDLQGRSLEEAAAKLDAIGGAAAAISLRPPRSFDEIDTLMQQVDLLAGVVTPETISSCSPYSWLPLPGGGFYLGCGGTETDPKREARLVPDALGAFTLELRSAAGVRDTVTLGDDVQLAVRSADRLIRQAYGDEIGRIANRNNRWRKEPPTPKQMQLLSRLGVPTEMMKDMTKGQASALITQKLARS
jgi:superfamily II DNA or RNA helicase